MNRGKKKEINVCNVVKSYFIYEEFMKKEIISLHLFFKLTDDVRIFLLRVAIEKTKKKQKSMLISLHCKIWARLPEKGRDALRELSVSTYN